MVPIWATLFAACDRRAVNGVFWQRERSITAGQRRRRAGWIVGMGLCLTQAGHATASLFSGSVRFLEKCRNKQALGAKFADDDGSRDHVGRPRKHADGGPRCRSRSHRRSGTTPETAHITIAGVVGEGGGWCRPSGKKHHI